MFFMSRLYYDFTKRNASINVKELINEAYKKLSKEEFRKFLLEIEKEIELYFEGKSDNVESSK